MRWTRFSHQDTIHYGIVQGDAVAVVDGTPFGANSRTGQVLPLASVKLLPPVIPGNFYAVGYNYAAHVGEANEFMPSTQKLPTRPEVGYRSNNALVGDGDNVVIPASSDGVIQFEGELVAVIGKTAKHVREEDALDYVLGFTIGNDISERVWQAADRTLWRSKNADTFKPMGPWIETDVKLDDLVTTVRLNGAQVSQFKTNSMIFGVARFIAEITKYMTMHPGDVLWMGAEAPTLDMRAGDHVEVEISGIGVLRNPIVRE